MLHLKERIISAASPSGLTVNSTDLDCVTIVKEVKHWPKQHTGQNVLDSMTKPTAH